MDETIGPRLSFRQPLDHNPPFSISSCTHFSRVLQYPTMLSGTLLGHKSRLVLSRLLLGLPRITPIPMTQFSILEGLEFG
jgi:hypothetical protein